MKEWIRNRANRGGTVPPLDLTRFIPSPLSSPVVNSANLQDSDGSPPLAILGARKPQFSPGHGETIYPLDTETPWNDTGFILIHNRHTQPPPPLTNPYPSSEAHFTPTSFPFSTYDDESVLSSSSAGLYDPFGRPPYELWDIPEQPRAPYQRWSGFTPELIAELLCHHAAYTIMQDATSMLAFSLLVTFFVQNRLQPVYQNGLTVQVTLRL
ncbi:hypothetical protein BS47DRAFT_1485531 [Hydnum rufescens UP504]|uniref:Uncharacterized protein n=1 Tax=Hydnum rufescens UP504 TaxID=1448309 RepID=A0A9P6AXB7_9AGAM|nr:hypothetical protein BS47DRAFT_1485531 [Hydnum rufescens UP504]